MSALPRTPEPELMDLADEAKAYAAADFSSENAAFVARLCELAPCDSALCVDLGCGPADIPIRTARARPGWRITAVDAAEAMLEIARADIAAAHLTGRVETLLADACRTGLPAGGFDVVMSNSILHHVADPEAFWREVRRLARPGAQVFVRDLFRPASAEAARAIVAAYAGDESPLLQEEFYRSLLAAYTPDEIRDQLAAADLPLDVAAITDRHVDVWGRIG